MLGIVVSLADSASVNIGEQLLDLAAWERVDPGDDAGDPLAPGAGYRLAGAELRVFETLHIHLADADAAFGVDLDLLAVVSRHAGETGPLLTAHHTGNFGVGDYGGDDRALARAAPNAHATVLDALATHAPEGYEVGAECTHHGPTDLETPSLFVEVGSDDPQWADPAAARAVARATLELRGVPAARERSVVGFGGGHYVPRFERIARETDWAVGHVAADWCLDDLGRPADHADVIAAAFERSAATRAVFDGDHPALADLRSVVEGLGHRVVSETWLRETTGVPLSLVETLETAVCPIDEGLRFGERVDAVGGDDPPEETWTVLTLPAPLVETVSGIDGPRAVDAVLAVSVAVETAEGGNRLGHRVVLPADIDGDAVLDALVPVLAAKFDRVEREPGAVVVHETRFSPAKAATLGVPEGPAFGRLAAGDPVEVGDREIPPDAVHEEHDRRFDIE